MSNNHSHMRAYMRSMVIPYFPGILWQLNKEAYLKEVYLTDSTFLWHFSWITDRNNISIIDLLQVKSYKSSLLIP